MNFKKILGRIVTLFLLAAFVFAGSAQAIIELTFSEALNSDQIDLFWQGDPSGPDQDGLPVSGDPTSNLTETTPAKPDTTPPSLMYLFWAGDPPEDATSKSTYVRVWSDGAKPMGSYYTNLWGSTDNNPAGDTVSKNMDVNFLYVKANAGQAIISQYSETGTTILYPTFSASKTVTFTSIQLPVMLKTVQIKEAEWDVNGTVTSGGATKTITGISAGDSYTVKVRHKSYWGDWGDWSGPVTYTVGEGGEGGAIVTLNLIRLMGGSGINSFAVPNTTCTVSETKKDGTPVTITTTSVTTALDLCKVINEVYGEPLARTFGYWDAATQTSVGVVVEYSGSTISNTGDLSAHSLQPGMGYQVYIAPDADVAVNISFKLQ